MMSDVLAVMWKEWRELTKQRTTRVGFAIIVGVFGVVLPISAGRDAVRSSFQIITLAFLPFTLTIPIIADAFAGERERHTLETLLASRLSESDILLGKVATAVTYSMSGVLTADVLQVVVGSAREGALVAPPADIALAGLLLAFGIACAAATIGVLVSLRAKTVRQAQQILGFTLMGLVFGSQILFQVGALAGARRQIFEFIGANGPATLALAVAGFLLALAALLLAAGRAAFRRDKLLLD